MKRQPKNVSEIYSRNPAKTDREPTQLTLRSVRYFQRLTVAPKL